MMDAAKNAKTVGFLIIVFGVISAFLDFINLFKFPDFWSILALLLDLARIAVGVGLRQTKVWSVYGLGILLLTAVFFTLFFTAMGEEGIVTPGSIVTLAIHAALFFWFYSARKKFSK